MNFRSSRFLNFDHSFCNCSKISLFDFVAIRVKNKESEKLAGTGGTIDEIISKPGKWGNPPIPTNDSLHPLSAGNKIYFIKFILFSEI